MFAGKHAEPYLIDFRWCLKCKKAHLIVSFYPVFLWAWDCYYPL